MEIDPGHDGPFYHRRNHGIVESMGLADGGRTKIAPSCLQTRHSRAGLAGMARSLPIVHGYCLFREIVIIRR